jgi:nucleotide-binding universal stress UspA family protein
MFTSIMVALDGSPQANDALSAASAMANLTGGNLHLITVPQRILVPAMDGMMTYPLPFDQEEMVRSGKEILAAGLALVPEKLNGRTTTKILYGDPAHAIVEEAKTTAIDLIVLGRRGLGTFTGLLLGSTTTKVSQLAPCAVLTVK